MSMYPHLGRCGGHRVCLLYLGFYFPAEGLWSIDDEQQTRSLNTLKENLYV